jgi:hypothetical protein
MRPVVSVHIIRPKLISRVAQGRLRGNLLVQFIIAAFNTEKMNNFTKLKKKH